MRSNIVLGTPGYYGTGSCLITRDYAAGSKNRYTVYYIPPSPCGRIKIIGRELPFGYANNLAKKYLEKLLPLASKRLKKAIKNNKIWMEFEKCQ